MRKSILGAMLAVGAVVSGGAALRAQQIQVNSTNRTIAVTTTESAERRADTAVVHIGYMIYAPTSDAVTEQAATLSKAIIHGVTATGVAATSIDSDGESTAPVQNFQDNGLTPEEKANRKFDAEQSWTVRVPAADASTVLAAAVSAGANQSGAVDWSVADEASLSAEAAGKALKHAREIAVQMAAGLDAKLGALIYASNEAQSIRLQPLFREMSEGSGGGMGAGVARTQLELLVPMVTRSATVSAVFAIQ